MCTLLCKYNEIYDNKNRWLYYNNSFICDNPFSSNVCDATNNFIVKYFQLGGKSDVLDSRFPFEPMRDIHSISTFFLGFIVKELIINDDELKPDFRYLWFLACLYHDYGYSVENNKLKYIPKNFGFNKMVTELGIDLALYKSGYKMHFTKSLVQNYYRYGINERCTIDHGIIGGLLLYSKLKIILKEAIDKGTSYDGLHFEYMNLIWAQSDEEYYAMAADAIIAHNIWYSTQENTKKIYKDYRLGKLIISKLKEFDGFENKLLPLLILCDTIEPVKAFSQMNPQCVLQKVKIEASPQYRTITITVLDDCLNYQSWFKKIEDLKKWLNVKVDPFGSVLVITLPPSAAMLATQIPVRA